MFTVGITSKLISNIRFEELPVALFPDKPYDKDGCWSGTAIVKDDKLFLFYASIHDGLKIKRSRRKSVVYKGEIKDLKIIRDEYILEVFVNGGEEIYSVLL